MSDIMERARAQRAWLVALRRRLHRFPELSLHEGETARRCREQLVALGWQVRGAWGHGLIADLPVEGATKRVALRADMDALPIQEENDADYQSVHAGVAHMCGHDAHMTIAIGAAKLLAEQKETLKVNARLILQPSEELPPGGALGMIEAGALDGVDAVYGLHNMPQLEVGVVATRAGILSAAADVFTARFIGRGGHASLPHQAVDPLPAMCGLVLQLQSIVARRCDPSEQAVLSVTRITGGTTHNIIPDACEIEGTVRTFSADVRGLIEAEMARMIPAIAAAHGLACDYTYTRGYDSIHNHAEHVRRVCEVARRVGLSEVNDAAAPQPWGEDFSYYLQHRPGAFFLLGSGDRSRGLCEPLHSPRFDIDEDCLVVGAALMASLVRDAADEL